MCRVHYFSYCEGPGLYCEFPRAVKHVLAQFRGGKVCWRWQAKGPSVELPGSLANSRSDGPRPRWGLQHFFSMAVGDATQPLGARLRGGGLQVHEMPCHNHYDLMAFTAPGESASRYR
jgi:hypothetical protein